MALNKNSPEANTCFNKEYNNFFEGFNYQTKDTFFFAFIIQFILMTMMYTHVPKATYWNILYISAVSGLIGAFIEHSTLAFICQKSQKENYTKVLPFLIEEIFWVICEYSIPILNLIKMKTLGNRKLIKVVKFLIMGLSIPFSVARLYDGYDRMMKGYLNTEMSKFCHGVAFGTMAVADIICTLAIIYLIKNKEKGVYISNANVISYIKNSSYFILIIIDMVSLTLSTLYIISTRFPEHTSLGSSTTLFHCLKSVFLLIIATDTMIFRYDIRNTESDIASTKKETEIDYNMASSAKYSIFNAEAGITSIDITKSHKI
ncbi:hypothetical protein BCR32DRAFT_295183 [Anaeromyces robustus]|uniref:Uncharacterized protein n=1 Tax=Anaeromyces robustus TaxID=1754192 RepID=A0A1Y1WXA7_9FUNG|nr:hypothetical protein BCR32DRAFT_295183 [Anaeromyces robustus]|eukprot:ORX78199.1 hypothetical protein BCR32DRAFT_295183 [Anaeromyces robustus]